MIRMKGRRGERRASRGPLIAVGDTPNEANQPSPIALSEAQMLALLVEIDGRPQLEKIAPKSAWET
jgi:hypothetical protein